MNSDLFHPYEKLVRIRVLGRDVEVPEKNSLLRCFQFLSMETISYGDFCWNGDCANCQVWCSYAGEKVADDKPVLACRTEVREGMVVTRLSGFIKLEGINSENSGSMAAKE
ncbi:MAG TPA: 2Fe-2S iron-sulfur cluster-binding protein [Pyrinomonadaceae bacterium]|nr:2Fe-2S iron-sulfur cluster-binding protein [Pyrinomonadaceae bacterium]